MRSYVCIKRGADASSCCTVSGLLNQVIEYSGWNVEERTPPEERRTRTQERGDTPDTVPPR